MLFGEGIFAGNNQSGFGGILGGVVSAIGGGSGGIPSFEGGGPTGSGPRSGGVDGRGGFPAILHPNETVIDHTRPSSSGQQTHLSQDVQIFTNDPNTRVVMGKPRPSQQMRQSQIRRAVGGGRTY